LSSMAPISPEIDTSRVSNWLMCIPNDFGLNAVP